MEKRRTIVLTLVSASLIAMILIAIFMHYPLNLIVDGIVLAVVGFATLIYTLIWSLLSDKVVVCDSHISIYKHGFPFWNLREKKVAFREIEFYVKNGSDTILSTRHGDLIHINRSVHDSGGKIDSLPDVLDKKRIKRVSYHDFIKGIVKPRNSYLSKI